MILKMIDVNRVIHFGIISQVTTYYATFLKTVAIDWQQTAK